MVCLGNICRSPLAEGILEQKIQQHDLDWQVDSAGTGFWHIGEPPDHRSMKVARNHGIDISGQRARQFSTEDFDNFDLLLAMDESNKKDMLRLAQNDAHAEKVKLILDYDAAFFGTKDVPDPYYDGKFEYTFDLLATACEKLLAYYHVTH